MHTKFRAFTTKCTIPEIFVLYPLDYRAYYTYDDNTMAISIH